MTQPLSDPFKRPSGGRPAVPRPAANARPGMDTRFDLSAAPASYASVIPIASVAGDPAVETLRRARRHLLALQHEPGHWVGELEGDTILESEYLLLREFMGWRDEERLRKAANYLRQKQGPDGGWRLYPGGPPDVSGSIKAYFALKLAGASPDEPCMRRARAIIRELGGLASANTFTKIYLALFGQCDWSATPAIPPEIVLLPRTFYFNLYEMSSWSRTILVPLSIVCAYRPTVAVPPGMGIEELQEGLPAPQGFQPALSFAVIHQARSAFRKARAHARGRRTAEGGRLERSHRKEAVFTWRNFFWVVDGALKIAERRPPAALRRKALRAAEAWMLARFERSGGLGAIFPPMVNALMALRCLGYADDDPQVVRARRELEAFEIEEADTLRMQPCISPVWDTALATMALTEGGLPPDHPALQRAARWLLAKEVRRPGDWSVKNPQTEPGGWYFEFENEFYPDVDDTAAVLMALRRVHLPGKEAAVRRGIVWVLSMQGRDGGWASFDRDNNRMVFSQVPFADHNAMLDPSTADITGRVLEMLGSYGYDTTHPAVRRGIDFLRREQEPDGAWYGRWGVNYIYGTWQVLKGLRVVGEPLNAPYVQRAQEWLRAHQNADGGWGETCDTYNDPSLRGTGPSTPSQTAWAVMGLMAAGDTESPALRRGIDYLCATQSPEGTWEESQFTGTGFPKVFYLRYHLYRLYFPIFALGMYARLHEMPRK
jgi:squalene-hopene/tetraprenyl-beta-curcumene cyclase